MYVNTHPLKIKNSQGNSKNNINNKGNVTVSDCPPLQLLVFVWRELFSILIYWREEPKKKVPKAQVRGSKNLVPIHYLHPSVMTGKLGLRAGIILACDGILLNNTGYATFATCKKQGMHACYRTLTRITYRARRFVLFV
jgi:hypothetical protein